MATSVNFLVDHSDSLGKELYEASLLGYVDSVKRLLARGAPVNWRDKDTEWTSLHMACYNNHPDVVKILAQQDDIDVNVQSTAKNTPLNWACCLGRLKCVQILMATRQCDLGAMGENGLTPLGVAVKEGRVDIIKYFMTKSNVNVTDSAHVVRILELTLEDGGDVTTKVHDNNRLLLACKFGYTAIVQYLINECNVDVHGAMTSDGLTPLGVAVREGHLDTIKYLISNCSVDVDAGRVKPISLAQNKDIVQLLLLHGATVEDIIDLNALGSPFSISIQPKHVSCKPGEEAEFTILTAPTASTCSYQWYFENQVITIQNPDYNGQTSNLLLILKFFPKHKGIYSCTAEDASGTQITSHQAALTADGEIIEQLEMKYIGRILEKSEINFGKFGIQTEHLLTGNCDVTYEEMEFIMNANPSTQVLSIDLKQEITSRMKEEQLYAEAIKKKVSISYTKILALGPGQVGKSTFIRRLLGIMEGNIQTSSSETQPQSSTGISELREACIQYTRVTGAITNNRKWCVMQDELHSQLHALMSLIVKQSQKHTRSTEFTQIIKTNEQLLPVASIAQTVAKELLVDDTVPSTKTENCHQNVSLHNKSIEIQPVLATTTQEANFTRQCALMPYESDIDKTIRDYEQLWDECKIYLERKEFDMLFTVADIGGQPAFLEMLPSLTIGPALYLVFMKLQQGLSSRYNVQFKCNDSKMKLCKNYSYTSEEVMFTALSSIACFGHSDEQVEMYIRKPSSQSETIRKDALALLVGTFLDEIQKNKQLKLEDVTNQLEKRLEDTAFYKEGLIHRKSFSLLVNNMTGDDSEIEQQRNLLEKIIKDKFREYEIPTQWLMLSICLKLLAVKQNKYHVSFDDCVLLGKRLGMYKDMVSVALQFLHKYLGLVMYFPHHEKLKKIVICDPQVVFSTISELIFNIYDPNENQVCEAQYDHFVETGCFSPQDITLINNKDLNVKRKLLSIDTLVDLLVHLNIAAKVPLSSAREEYFLPAVLQTAEIDMVKRAPKGKNEELLPEPICIRFKTGFLPLGFVCALSANLIAENKFYLLTGESNKFYKNRIQFRFQGKFNITMISWPRYCEFRVARHSGNDEFWSKDCCPLINKVVCTAANKVIQSMQHGLRSVVAKDSKMYELAFHCPRHSKADFGQESLAELVYDNSDQEIHSDKNFPDKAICTKCVTAIHPLTPEMMVWFGKFPTTSLRIVKQPARNKNVISISAEGVRPLTYKWFLGKLELCDNHDYENCTTDSLIILDNQLLSQGVYKCQVKDRFGICNESEEIDLFEEELRKWKLQEDEIIKLKCNGFRNVGDLLSVPDIDKLEFLNMLEKRRIQLIINSLIEKKTEDPPNLSLQTLRVELRTLTDPLQFGIQLNVPDKELAILSDHPHCDTNGKKTVLFQYIANNHKSRAITWSRIADALHNMHYGDLSQYIGEKYCTHTCIKQLQRNSRQNPLELVSVATIKETSDDPKENFPSEGFLPVVARTTPTFENSQTTRTEEQVLTLTTLKRRIGISDTQLDTEVMEQNMYVLASYFDNVENYLDQLGLTPSQQTDIHDLAVRQDIQTAMAKALKLWRAPNPFVATFRALLIILLDLKKGNVAVRVCQHIVKELHNKDTQHL